MPDYACRIIFLPEDKNEPVRFLPENIGLETQQVITVSNRCKGKLEYNHLLQERDCEYNNDFVEQPVNLHFRKRWQVLR